METVADRVRLARASLRVNQTEFGRLAGKRTKSAVCQWEKGATEPDWENLMDLEKNTGIRAAWIKKNEGDMKGTRQSHAAPDDDAIEGEVIVPRLEASTVPAPECHPILVWESPDDLPEGRYVLVPRRRVELSAGNGHLIFEEEEAPPLAFTTDWARTAGLKPASAVVVYAKGDSMEPRIREGDVLLVDLARREIADGKVYALRYNHELRVKRLFRRYDGALIVRSDNAAAYPDEVVPTGDQNGHVEVIGRVIWRGGDL
jgi:phage repressor protein C with HTH and peptisase S24 domain